MNKALSTQEDRDIKYHFHAYTNVEAHASMGPMVIEGGEGIYVFDNQGNKYIEAMSGLWSAAVGFGEKRIADVAYEQMQKLPYYHNFTHKSHDKVIDLAEKLVSIAPVPMSKVFFTNSGSEANDTVMKLVWYRSNALGLKDKKKMISRKKGYHGVTIASASLTGLPYNHESFDLPLDGVLHTTCPHYWRDGLADESEEQFATRCANDLEAMIQAEGPETVAAFFAEPVMGAGGVITPPATYWEKIQAVLDKHDVLLVADEVICGFGRTGNMFGSETYGIKPDVMVMSKQLTSTYFPLSALMVNDRFFDPIGKESGRIGVLGHGFTSGGHPVGAAIALENIRIIEEENLVENANEVGSHLLKRLHALADHPLVGEVRGVGMIAGLELVLDKQAKTAGDKPGQLGLPMSNALKANGVIVRNIGDTIAFCPPLITTQTQVDVIVDAVEKSLSEVPT